MVEVIIACIIPILPPCWKKVATIGDSQSPSQQVVELLTANPAYSIPRMGDPDKAIDMSAEEPLLATATHTVQLQATPGSGISANDEIDNFFAELYAEKAEPSTMVTIKKTMPTTQQPT
ncbi:hypothetical protein D6D01_10416 [Aureobasidium pullulans]|uniref:Uncharacterized protein n=1 Tax=Aureobasidium pullulans TaxID=5580 RepID=A0A4S9JEW6_AURPU|nr:hypothetical protein D6D01_10416 [Aureobasidium pullulans]